MRLLLALRAFFRVLFGQPLPPELLPALPAPAAPPVEVKAPEPVKAPPPEPVKAPPAPDPSAIAVRALAVFQAEGRLLDFLSEDIDGYSDAEVGAAVREIHRGCRRALADHFKLARVRGEDEDARITVPEGYDPAEIRLVGNVVGKPPFSGTLKHKGWRVEAVHLPAIPSGAGAQVVTPAEVEL